MAFACRLRGVISAFGTVTVPVSRMPSAPCSKRRSGETQTRASAMSATCTLSPTILRPATGLPPANSTVPSSFSAPPLSARASIRIGPLRLPRTVASMLRAVMPARVPA